MLTSCSNRYSLENTRCLGRLAGHVCSSDELPRYSHRWHVHADKGTSIRLWTPFCFGQLELDLLVKMAIEAWQGHAGVHCPLHSVCNQIGKPVDFPFFMSYRQRHCAPARRTAVMKPRDLTDTAADEILTPDGVCMTRGQVQRTKAETGDVMSTCKAGRLNSIALQDELLSSTIASCSGTYITRPDCS
jgi:hypothetical protein